MGLGGKGSTIRFDGFLIDLMEMAAAIDKNENALGLNGT